MEPSIENGKSGPNALKRSLSTNHLGWLAIAALFVYGGLGVLAHSDRHPVSRLELIALVCATFMLAVQLLTDWYKRRS